MLFDKHDPSIPVDGASDNLSGVAPAQELGRHFATERLQHTRVRIVRCERIPDAFASHVTNAASQAATSIRSRCARPNRETEAAPAVGGGPESRPSGAGRVVPRSLLR